MAKKNTPLYSTENILVPIVPWDRVEEYYSTPGKFSHGDFKEYIPCPHIQSHHIYAVRVVNDNMSRPMYGGLNYPVGTILFIDPERNEEPGNKVVVTYGRLKEPVCRQFIVDGDDKYLMPFMPLYAKEVAKKVDESVLFLGVIVGAYWIEIDDSGNYMQ